ncbi:MAG: sigma 54-interacting transcriptional regulator [Thermoanaerobaculia bacterium]
MRELLGVAGKVVSTDASVLILGESGVGKDFLAETLHALGPRAARALVRIDCASIPEDLFEAELFGHEKGAFTGALQRRPGRFEIASGGTVYLDEIAALPSHLQAKLLRVIQERQFTPLGSNRTIRTDVRLISSSNLPLEQLQSGDRLRPDLYFRLNVVSLTIPPLRERSVDIPSLARRLLRLAARAAGKTIAGFEPEALQIIRQYRWPGNVRELRHAIERAVLLEEGTRISAASLPREGFLGGGDLVAEASAQGWTLAALERKYVEEVLRQTGGNQTRAAAVLGISRKALIEKRKRWNR